MSSLTQEHVHEIPREFPRYLRELIDELAGKWDNFTYDKVIETHVYVGEEEKNVYYIHQWVDPPTKSFRDFVEDEFSRWYFEVFIPYRSKYDIPLEADEINQMYRDLCLSGGEHYVNSRINPRENGVVDEVVHKQMNDLCRPTRTVAGFPPDRNLWETKYWLL